MDKDIKKSISATDKDAQYDEKAKNLLGHKIILAHILVKTIDEFKGMNPKGMNPKDAVQYIEGEPYISRVPVDAGSTNVGIKEQAYVEGTENGIAIGKQEGITIGKQEGIAETIVKMYRKGYEAEQISDILDMEVEEVRKIIENE